MIHSLTNAMINFAQAPVEITTLDRIKDLVNRIGVPQYSLPIFFLVFVAAFLFYRKWTKPIIFWPIMIIFCVIYFGMIPLDHNYAAILTKPDNVPITMMILSLIYFLWLSLRQAAINDTNREQGKPLIEEDKDDKVLCWPDLVYVELICMILCTVGLIVWSIFLKAPLEAPANPAGPPNPSKAPWYFLGLQEMLVYFDPWMAGVVLPGLIILGLAAIPYIDTNPKGNGYYTLQERKFAILTWMFGFVILWVVLIVFGTFLRGPNWNFFGPFMAWDPHRIDKLTNINLSEIFWIKFLNRPLPTALFVREWLGILLTLFWVGALPQILPRVIPLFRRLRFQLGLARYQLMALLFVIMALVPIKMVGRWLFNLKYIIAMPEINFNL